MFSEVLANTLSPDHEIRTQAEKFLKDAEAENYSEFLISLGQILFNPEQQTSIRQSAAITLKNAIKIKPFIIDAKEATPWLSVPADIKDQIKLAALDTLNAPETLVSLATAQVLVVLAEVELPCNSWPELIPTLVERANSEVLISKLSSLRALGFICESLAQTNPEILAQQSSNILTAVINSANTKEVENEEIRLAAITALQNSLYFITANFDSEFERNFIMEVVCNNTGSSSEELQVVSFQCLSDIVCLYYNYMASYFAEGLAQLTYNGFRSDSEQVVLQAIDFWARLAETETSLLDTFYDEYGDEGSLTSQNFLLNNLNNLLPLILEHMTRQEEGVDEEEWTASKSAGSCLQSIALCVKDPIVEAVLPFIHQNISNPSWQFREAAVLAFGCILDGPDHGQSANLVNQGFYKLLELMEDPSENVRDTVSWTLGRICDYHPDCIQPSDQLPQLLHVLVKGLDSSPTIVINCCWAILNLTKAFSQEPYDKALPLAPFFEGLFSTLLAVSERFVALPKARTSVYEAISVLVEHCPANQLKLIENVAIEAIKRLEHSLVLELQIVNIDDRINVQSLQSGVCGVLQASISTLKESISPVADQIMEILLRMLSVSKSAENSEDIFNCVGAMIISLDSGFKRYVDAFAPHLLSALQNTQDVSLCCIATGLLGDVSRALGEDSVPHTDTFMSILGQNLQQPNLSQAVRGAIFGCFGDIASAVCRGYQPYLAPSMQVLYQFMSQLTGQIVESYTPDSLVSLFENVIESYVGIVQGFREPESCQELTPYIGQFFYSLTVCSKIEDPSESLIKSMVGLIGDLAEIFPSGKISEHLREPWVGTLLKNARSKRYSSNTRKIARWARTAVTSAGVEI